MHAGAPAGKQREQACPICGVSAIVCVHKAGRPLWAASHPRTPPPAAAVACRHGAEVPPEDDRTISNLLLDQIEFADVIILNKVDLLRANSGLRAAAAAATAKFGSATKRSGGGKKKKHPSSATAASAEGEAAVQRLLAALRKLNPRARVIAAEHSNVPLSEVLNTGRFDMQQVRARGNGCAPAICPSRAEGGGSPGPANRPPVCTAT